MKSHSRYSIVIENESRLERIFQVSLSPWKIYMVSIGIVLVLMIAGALLLAVSPAQSLLPGYLKDSERAATEEQHMRLDSIQQAYLVNEKFIANIMDIMGTSDARHDAGSKTSQLDTPFSVDSLLPQSPEETDFVNMMREREKYNISVIAPLAAESMMFSPVNEESVITADSRKSRKAKVVLANRMPVSATADGTVISVSQSIRDGGGATVIIQHPKGFLSRFSRLGTVLIEPGDKVSGGQIIALTPSGKGIRHELIFIEMWHNGTPLVPYEYLYDSISHITRHPVIDTEVGRGRL